MSIQATAQSPQALPKAPALKPSAAPVRATALAHDAYRPSALRVASPSEQQGSRIIGGGMGALVGFIAGLAIGGRFTLATTVAGALLGGAVGAPATVAGTLGGFLGLGASIGVGWLVPALFHPAVALGAMALGAGLLGWAAKRQELKG